MATTSVATAIVYRRLVVVPGQNVTSDEAERLRSGETAGEALIMRVRVLDLIDCCW